MGEDGQNQHRVRVDMQHMKLEVLPYREEEIEKRGYQADSMEIDEDGYYVILHLLVARW